MAWITTIDGHEVDSDDFLLDDLAYIEKHAKTFWSITSPLKSAKTAEAFVRVALVRSGVPEADADERLKSLTLRDINAAFRWRDDPPAKGGSAEGNDSGPTGRTSPSSSPGEPASSDGPPSSPDASG